MGIIVLIYLFLFIYIFICLINNELFFWIKKSQNISPGESVGVKNHFHGELSKCKRIDDCLENSDYKEYTSRKVIKKLFTHDAI